MTMHDDSNLELLERDLTALSAPHEGDEALRRALRDDLAAALLRSGAPRRRRSIRYPIGAAAVAAIAAAVAVIALLGTGGSDGPAVASAAIVHHALEAVTPPANSILHTEVVGVQNGTTVVGETWQETSPPYA